jgi:hypothetical protein
LNSFSWISLTCVPLQTYKINDAHNRHPYCDVGVIVLPNAIDGAKHPVTLVYNRKQKRLYVPNREEVVGDPLPLETHPLPDEQEQRVIEEKMRQRLERSSLKTDKTDPQSLIVEGKRQRHQTQRLNAGGGSHGRGGSRRKTERARSQAVLPASTDSIAEIVGQAIMAAQQTTSPLFAQALQAVKAAQEAAEAAKSALAMSSKDSSSSQPQPMELSLDLAPAPQPKVSSKPSPSSQSTAGVQQQQQLVDLILRQQQQIQQLLQPTVLSSPLLSMFGLAPTTLAQPQPYSALAAQDASQETQPAPPSSAAAPRRPTPMSGEWDDTHVKHCPSGPHEHEYVRHFESCHD